MGSGMPLEDATPAAEEQRAAPGAVGDTRLRGWRLIVARAVVFPTFAFAIFIFVLALPGAVEQMATPCADWFNTCLLSPQQAQRLIELGVAPVRLAVAIVALFSVAMAVSAGVGALLIWRRSDDWMALLVGLTLALTPLQYSPFGSSVKGWWQAPAQIMASAAVPLFFLLMLLFPSGRFAPRWLWLLVGAVALALTVFGPQEPPEFGLSLALASVLLLIAGQVYRYLRVSTPLQREQTKWAVYGFGLALVINQLFWQTYGNIPGLAQPDSLYFLLAIPDYFLIIVVLAACFGVAILRYRLYDIDVIIRRTLVYGVVIAVLGALYLALVLGLQAATQALIRQSGEQPLITVLSTLLIVALFTPLRRWVQAGVDRRFYRRKYDATQTIAAFSAALRTETDLDALNRRLTQVAEETMQPAHISLWMAPLARSPRQQVPVSPPATR
jgi:hypothetical protein